MIESCSERPLANGNRLAFLAGAAVLLLGASACVEDIKDEGGSIPAEQGPIPPPPGEVVGPPAPPPQSTMPPNVGTVPSTSPGDGGMPPAAATGLLADPLSQPPMDLKDVGLYTALPDITKTHPKAFYYEPRHALWSNGLAKHRYAVLPDGQKVDTSVRDGWDFPVGTLFFKTFTYQKDGQEIPVETRLIRRSKTEGEPQEQWEFFVWGWNPEGTAASLLEIRLTNPRQITMNGMEITHTIPKRGDCWNCHIANKSPIIGFDELRLNSTLAGENESQLDQVIAKEWLTAAPPKPWLEITDSNPMQKQVLEYVHGNCAHCHNGLPALEPGARYDALDLRWDKVLEQTVNKMTMTVGTADGVRIVPGNAMESILFLAMEQGGVNAEVKLMPPVGVDLVDMQAIDLLRQWINGMAE